MKTDVKGSPRASLYKLLTDNGGAPATSLRRLSIAICKPHIGAAAEVGDWIVGIAGKCGADLSVGRVRA